MYWTIRAAFCCLVMLSACCQFSITCAQTNPFTKGQVADRIRKVEDGVDEFQKYLNNRGDDAKDRAQSAQNSGRNHAASVVIQQTPKTAGTKLTKQRTISRMPWTI